MPPLANPPFEPVQNSNYLVLKAEIKKTKTIITTNLKTLDNEIMKLKKVPPPPYTGRGPTWQQLSTATALQVPP